MFSDTVEEHVHFRHFDTDGDLVRLAQLLTEIERVDQAGEDTSEETLKAQLSLPGHDPYQDRWVVTSNEKGRWLALALYGRFRKTIMQIYM